MARIATPARPPIYDDSAARTRATASASRLALNLRDGIDHLLGYRMRGMIHRCRRDSPIVTIANELGGFWTYRHPNCDYLHVWAQLVETGNGEAYFQIQAGSGSQVRIGPGYGGLPIGGDEIETVVPWGAMDSGYQEVKISSVGVNVRTMVISELYQPFLTVPPQFGVLTSDPTYPLIGMAEGSVIGFSNPAGPEGVLNKTKDTWRYGIRQAQSWWRTEQGVQVDSTSWVNPFAFGEVGSNPHFRHRARQKKTETYREYRVYVWSYQSSGSGGYQWRLRSTLNTLTTPTLTNTAGAWYMLQGLQVKSTADDQLIFEMRRLGSLPNNPVYAHRISVIEEIETE